VHKTENRETTAGCPSTGQKCDDAGDDEDNDSDNASVSTDSSEYSLGSQFEEILNDSEVNVSDREFDRAFSNLRHTKGCLKSSI
jgi:hypothetical protein